MGTDNPLDDNDFEKRCLEESKIFLLESIKTGTRRMSEAAAKLLAYDMDEAAASELLGQLETLPGEPQRILFRKAAQLIDKDKITDFCKKLLSQEDPPPLVSEAIVIIHQADAALAERTLLNLLSSGEESYVCNALTALRDLVLPAPSRQARQASLPQFKPVLLKLAGSGYVRIRRLVWEIIGGYPLSDDERAQLLGKGLADFDPLVRASAVSIMPAANPDKIAAYMNDPQPNVRIKAALKLVAAGVGAGKFLEYTGYAHAYAEEAARSYGDLLSTEQAEKFASSIIDFCAVRGGMLKKIMALVDTEAVYGAAIRQVLHDEFAGWRRVMLRNWAFLNRRQDLMKLLPLRDDPDKGTSRHTIEVFLNNLPGVMHDAVTEGLPAADLARSEKVLIEIFSTLPAAVKAMLAAAARNSWLKLSDETRRTLIGCARQDANKWVAEEAVVQ